MEFSLENMCRTCMNEEGLMFSVYDKEDRSESNSSYADMLMTLASVQVDKEDGLPNKICQYCLKQLLIAYTFKQTSERSDATLREITKNPDIEFIKQEITDTYSDIEVNLNSNSSLTDVQIETDDIQIKSESPDFKLSAEFLDDDFQVEEENMKVENCTEIESDTEKQNLEIVINSFKKNNKLKFSPDIEQLKLSVLKPKARPVRQQLVSNVQKIESVIPVSLKSVSKSHKPVKQYICPLCSKQFVKYETFKKHKRLHTTLKCELCDKEFRSTHGLRYHMKIHSGVKNYACTFENCTKRFRLKQALDKHLSIHNNEKNHLCPICGKTYAQYDALHYHIRNHSGERPYLCMHCGKTFKQSCHLKNHMWNHTGIKPHKCKTCGKCYTTGHQLKKHLRKYCNNPANQNTDDTKEVVSFHIDQHTYETETYEEDQMEERDKNFA